MGKTQKRGNIDMICKNCGFSNADGAVFCENCGSNLNAQADAEQNEQVIVEPVNEPVNKQVVVEPVNTVNYVNAGAAGSYTAQTPSEPGKGFAIAGMVCGIVSFFCFGFITGLLGVIFGAVAKSKGCKSGMATAGIVCGVLGVVLWLISILACGGMELLGMLM